MIIRRANNLGKAHSDTLTLRCHFAFADYQDSEYVHEGRLRAINLGSMLPNSSYRLGPEKNLDIVTWLQTGTLWTKADNFSSNHLHSGGLQLINAGTGVCDMEWHSGADGASFIQFWFMADTEGGLPEQEIRAAFPKPEDGGFRIIASGFPEDDPEELGIIEDDAPVKLSARSRLLYADIPAGEGAAYQTTPGRDLYIVVVSGEMTLNGENLSCGDGVMLPQTQNVTIIANCETVILLCDVSV
ncbi:pirin family protein [Acetobacter syzygii]|uniref:pirin family protein n=1 Tax=Acetobacter syzygii TaxID=146476 RepID=UPI0039EACB13